MVILYGGSFNPPTMAHFEIVKKLKASFTDALIVLMPVGNRYPKSNLVAAKHRIAMLELMIEEFDNVIISDFEITKPFIGTIRALEYLEEKYQTNAVLAIGADNIGLPNWIEGPKLLEKYKIVILNRNGNNLEQDINFLTENYFANISLIDFDYDISSSKIREDIEKYKNHLLPKVYDYIKTHSLYEEE